MPQLEPLSFANNRNKRKRKRKQKRKRILWSKAEENILIDVAKDYHAADNKRDYFKKIESEFNAKIAHSRSAIAMRKRFESLIKNQNESSTSSRIPSNNELLSQSLYVRFIFDMNWLTNSIYFTAIVFCRHRNIQIIIK